MSTVVIQGTPPGGQPIPVAVDANGNAQTVMIASGSGVGSSVSRNTAVTNIAIAAKTSSGRVYGLHIQNTNVAQDNFVHFYDLASGSVVVGTTVPTRSFFLADGAVLDVAITVPHSYATAITIAASTTANGGTAPTTGLYVQVEFL